MGEYVNISRNQYDKNILKLAELIKRGMREGKFNPEIERNIGRLLGYREKDIEYFIQSCIERPQDKQED